VGGVVVMEATIDVEGNVTEVKLLRGVRDDLDKAAIEAAREWKYEPTIYDGHPIEVLVTFTVSFWLQE